MVHILDIQENVDIPHTPNFSHILENSEKLMGRCQIANKRHRPVSNIHQKTPPDLKYPPKDTAQCQIAT